jgi:hypothetical protein
LGLQNVGLRLSAEQVVDGIKEREIGDERVAYAVVNPAIFAEDGGPSIAERMALRGVRFQTADNTRIGRLGAAAGWDLVRQRLVGEDGVPMLYVAGTCVNLIRSLPTLQHDARRPEDLESTGDDHCTDWPRYAVASWPWVKVELPHLGGVTINLLWTLRERERLRWQRHTDCRGR